MARICKPIPKYWVKPTLEQKRDNRISLLTTDYEYLEQDMEEVMSECCDDPSMVVNNDYIGVVFQWLVDNDYVICKK